MTLHFGVVMDPIESIHYKKDSTLPVLLEAQKRGCTLFYFEIDHLFLRDGVPYGHARKLTVFENSVKWFELGKSETIPLADLNIIFMRKDPPFNEAYLYATFLLDHAEKTGVRVVNRPQALRDANEKIFATYFAEFCPPSLVSASIDQLHAFWQEEQDIVCKPLNSMGGTSIFRLKKDEVNANVIFKTLTEEGSQFIMAQRFIPEITAGDKRILLINGEVIPFALARIPQGNDWRGNLAVGAKGIVQPLSQRDLAIAESLGPTLRDRGFYFVGIDVIGNYLTEINVTSPTGIRELTAGSGIDISAKLMDAMMG